MDDGTGNTNSLTLQNVTINNFANVIFQRGGNRNLTLVTGSFNLNSNAPAAAKVIMDTTYGILNWTLNGNLNLSHGTSLWRHFPFIQLIVPSAAIYGIPQYHEIDLMSR